MLILIFELFSDLESCLPALKVGGDVWYISQVSIYNSIFKSGHTGTNVYIYKRHTNMKTSEKL